MKRDFFSLIELCVVIGIILIIISITLPSFSGITRNSRINSCLRELKGYIENMIERSTSIRRSLYLVYDIPQNTYTVRLSYNTTVFYQGFLKKHSLDYLKFYEVKVGAKRFIGESVSIQISPDGFLPSHYIYLADKDREVYYTLYVNGLLGRVVIKNGFVDDIYRQEVKY